MTDRFEQILFDTLLPSAIDVSIVAVLVGSILSLVKSHMPPFWRHILWLLVPCAIVFSTGPESTTSWKHWLQTPDPAVGNSSSLPSIKKIDKQPSPPTDLTLLGDRPNPVESFETAQSTVRISWRKVASLIWIALVAALLFLYGARLLLFRKTIVRHRCPDGLHRCNAALDELLREKRYLFQPTICISRAIHSPALIGIFRPTILLPPDIATESSDQQLLHILRHELAHIRRGDLATGLLYFFTYSIQWFNPLAWYAFHRFRIEAERATDARVLTEIGQADASKYGQSLLAVLEKQSHRKVRKQKITGLVAIAENRNDVRERLQFIASFQNGKNAKGSLLSIAILAILAITLLTEAKDPKSSSDTVIQRVQVKDDQGNPIGKARVHLMEQYGKGFYQRLHSTKETDSIGFATFRIQAPQHYYNVIALSDEHGIGGANYWPDIAADEALPVTLAATDSLSVRVLGPDGKAIPNLPMHIERIHGLSQFPLSLPAKSEPGFTAKTNEQGICHFPEIPVTGQVYINHKDPRFAHIPSIERPNSTWHRAGEKEITLHLRRGYTARGRVLLPSGQPSTESQVNFYSDDPQRKARILAATLTDNRGNFTVPSLAEETYFAVAHPPTSLEDELSPVIVKEIEIKEGADLSPLTIPLKEGGVIQGKLKMADGSPPPFNVNIQSSLSDWPDFDNYGLEADENGHFSFRVPSGEHTIYLSSHTNGIFRSRKKEIIATIQEGETFEPEFIFEDQTDRTDTVWGTVTSPTGTPAKAMIYLGAGKGSSGIPGTGIFETDADGKFAIRIPTRDEPYFEGPYFLSAIAIGRGTQAAAPSPWLKLEPGKLDLQLLPIDQLSSFKGRIVDKNKKPLRGLRLLAGSTEHRSYLHRFIDPDPIVTDADGRFFIRARHPNDVYRITVLDGSSTEIPIDIVTEPGITKDLGEIVYEARLVD